MTKREARRIAYGVAYRFVQQALDGAGYGGETGNAVDQAKIDDALDTIAQQLYERSCQPLTPEQERP
jgi:hypothetical protein